MSVYKLTCFIEEEPAVLFPLLIPLRFQLLNDNSIIWQNEGVSFKIIPFTSRGRGLFGYHVHYNGNPESCQYLMDQFLGVFNPTISGIEWVHESEKSQSELIKLSDKAKFERCSHLGLYEHDGIGIVLLPNSEVHLQVRCRMISIPSLTRYITEMVDVAAVYQETPYNLFSFEEETSAVYSW